MIKGIRMKRHIIRVTDEKREMCRGNIYRDVANHFPNLNKRNPQIERWDIDIGIYICTHTGTHITYI